MTGRVIVLGSINTDLVVKVSHLPRPGETVIGGSFYKNQGGKGANQAVAAARSGQIPVVLVAAIGDDLLGRESYQLLRLENIDLRFVREKRGCPSGVALIVVDEKGENAIAVASGANALLSPRDVEHLPDELFGPRSVLLTCLEIPLDTVRAGLKRAKAAESFTILNPAPVPRDFTPDLLADVDLITPNEQELAQVTGLPVRDENDIQKAGEKLLALGVKRIIVTLGPRGCLFMDGSTAYQFPAYRVQAVDTTGAGDAFNGALAVAIAEGRPWPDAIRFASAAAAFSVTKPGAQPSLPTREEIEEFLRAHS